MTGVAPRFTRRRAAASVLVGMTAVGLLLGGVWAALAPPVHGVIALNRADVRVQTYLGEEADHFFFAAFLMLGLLWVVAVVTPVLVWQWRAHRGPLLAAAVSLGAVLSAAAATTVATVLTRMRFPAVDIDTAPVDAEQRIYYYTEGPSAFFGTGPLQIAATLLVPAATAALVYALFAVSTTRDDLGAYPPQEPPPLPMPIPAGGEQSAVEPGQR